MPNKDVKESWEERFDEEFVEKVRNIHGRIAYEELKYGEQTAVDELRDFIRQELQSERERIIQVAEGMKKPSLTKPAREGVIGTMAINSEYNLALSDLLTKLQAQKELIENN